MIKLAWSEDATIKELREYLMSHDIKSFDIIENQDNNIADE